MTIIETINGIKHIFATASYSDLPIYIKQYENDKRAGVISLVTAAKKKQLTYDNEKLRLLDMSKFETIYQDKGYINIAGIDEVGRGPVAGPVLSSAVILRPGIDLRLLGINDSKKLSEKKRNFFYDLIQSEAIAIGIGIVEPDIIDKINILEATKLSMKYAVENIKKKPDCLLIDAITLHDINIHQRPIIGGDTKSVSIAAASIIAKVTRDYIMEDYHKIYPNYNFLKNKGYGTKEHMQAIANYGLTPIHRRSFL